MRETRLRSLGQEDPLEKEMGTHSVFLPRKSHGERSLEGYGPRNSKRVAHYLATEQKKQISIQLVQFSCSVISDSLQPHESQHTRPPCPSPTPGVHPNSCPSSQWCHPAISSSVFPFSSCPQTLPASVFSMSQLFTSGGQSIGVSALASFLPKNTQGWSPLELTGWISLQSKGLSRIFSNTTVQKHQFFGAQLSSQSCLLAPKSKKFHITYILGKINKNNKNTD